MRRLQFLGFLVVLVSLISGCATKTPMALSDATDMAALQKKSIYLITVTIKNQYKTSWQPKLRVLHVEKAGAEQASDRFNFLPDEISKVESDSVDGNTYFLRMELPKGDYDIKGMMSLASHFPFNGFFFTPILQHIVVDAPGLYYLGHVDATVRERVGNEFKAGPTLPLLDQAVAGASTGTFDVVISDQWGTDESNFKRKFPVLENAHVIAAVLAPFDRQKAQQWWETH